MGSRGELLSRINLFGSTCVASANICLDFPRFESYILGMAERGGLLTGEWVHGKPRGKTRHPGRAKKYIRSSGGGGISSRDTGRQEAKFEYPSQRLAVYQVWFSLVLFVWPVFAEAAAWYYERMMTNHAAENLGSGQKDISLHLRAAHAARRKEKTSQRALGRFYHQVSTICIQQRS